MTVQDVVRSYLPELTVGQTKLANTLLADYPFAGLQSIQQLAESVGISTPSISRFVTRLGFSGFGDFQNALIGELREGSRSPRDLRALGGDGAGPEFLATYTQRFADLVRRLPESISQQQIDSVAELLADPGRAIYLRGGRISDTLARFLSVHLCQMRAGVHHLPDDPELWADSILQMRRGDVVVLFDFRRYQPIMERLAATIHAARRAQIVLITDKWQSPAARHCSHVIALPIEIGTAWDTVACAMALIEALIVTVSEHDWHSSEHRIAEWDAVRASLLNPNEDRP